MTCAEVLSRISAYYDGELESAARDQIASHLAECPICSAYLRDLALIGELLRSDRTCEVPEGLWGRVAAAAQQTIPARRLRVRSWLVRAAAVAAGFVFNLFGFGAMKSALEPQQARQLVMASQIEQVLRESSVALATPRRGGETLGLLDQRPEARLVRELLTDAKP